MNPAKQVGNARKEDGRDIPAGSKKTIRLTDLIPKKTVKGGSQVIFGSSAAESKEKPR